MQDDLDAWLAGDDESEVRGRTAFDVPPGPPAGAPGPFGRGPTFEDPPDPFGPRRPPSGRRPAPWDDAPRRPGWQRAAVVAGIPCLVLVALLVSRGTPAATDPSAAAEATADAAEVPAPAAMASVPETFTPATVAPLPSAAASVAPLPAAPVPAPPGGATAPGDTVPAGDADGRRRETLVGAAAVTAVRTGLPVDAGAGRQRYVDLAAVEAIDWRGDLAVVRVLAVILEGADGQVTDTTVRRYAVAARDAGSTAELLGGPWPLGGPVAIVGQPGLQYEQPQDPSPFVAALEAAGWSQVTVSSVGRDPALPGIVAAVVEAVVPGDTTPATHTPWLSEEGTALTLLGS